MHSSRMRTVRSLTVSRCILGTHPAIMYAPHTHTPQQPCMPPLPATIQPLSNHACPPQPHMPLATMHTPHNHACPQQPHMHPPQPCMPPSNHECPLPPSNHTCPLQQPCTPPSANHAYPPQPCMPPSNHTLQPHPTTMHVPPWTEFLTYASENITLPQTSFAGGKKHSDYAIMVLKL